MSRVDRILDLLDNAHQHPGGFGYGTDHDDRLCARCQRHQRHGGELCAGCRAWLLGDTEVDPVPRQLRSSPVDDRPGPNAHPDEQIAARRARVRATCVLPRADRRALFRAQDGIALGGPYHGTVQRWSGDSVTVAPDPAVPSARSTADSTVAVSRLVTYTRRRFAARFGRTGETIDVWVCDDDAARRWRADLNRFLDEPVAISTQ